MLYVFYDNGSECLEYTAKARELIKENTLTIPHGERARMSLFTNSSTDLLGSVKIIRNSELFIIPHNVEITFHCTPQECISTDEILKNLHSKIKLKVGNMKEKYSEQVITTLFVRKDSKVLELGSNIGCNSLIIASLLESDENMVAVESNPEYIPILTENRDINNYKFKIENIIISKIPLLQHEQEIVPYTDSIPSGYSLINTMSYQDLKEKYNITFDTLIVGNGEEFYYSLKHEPDMLEGIETLIIGNNYKEMAHHYFVEECLINNEFHYVYSMNLEKGASDYYSKNFYKAWKRGA